MQTKQLGFTLIELIIVIVILGILAVTASPKFLSLSSDARIATLEALEGAMRTSTNLVNIKATMENKLDCATDPTIEMSGENIALRCGYPCPHPSGITATLEDEDGFTWIGGNCGGQLGYIEVQADDAPDPSNCKIRYTSARETQPPTITPTTDGC